MREAQRLSECLGFRLKSVQRSLTSPVAVELLPLASVTVSVMVLLVVPNLKLQIEELEQMRVPLLFQTYRLIGSLPRVLVLENLTTILALTGTDRRSVPPSFAVLSCALIEK